MGTPDGHVSAPEPPDSPDAWYAPTVRSRRRRRPRRRTSTTTSTSSSRLALFDDRVGIAGFDEETGTMRVFVDSDSAIARAWADRVFETYRDNSDEIETPRSVD